MIEWFGWPAAVAVLGAFFMILFREPIRGILNRTKRIGKGGLETFDTQLQPPKENPDAMREFMSSFDNPVLVELEEAICEDLKKRGISDPPAVQTALVRSLASTQILLHFEMAQQSIWASQIATLTFLNARQVLVPVEEVQPFYEDAQSRFPELYQHGSFEQWLAYLLSWRLAQVEGGRIGITTAGREFLKWRIHVGRGGPFYG